MYLADLASDIWREELGEDSSISVAAITQWLRTHIGDLNSLINQGFYINTSYEIVDENGSLIDIDATAIYKKIYLCYYFRRQSQLFLGANGIDSVTSVTQDGITVRGVERNGVAKTYNELLKGEKEALKTLVNNYKYNRGSARQVVGDDVYSKNFPVIKDPTNNATLFS